MKKRSQKSFVAIAVLCAGFVFQGYKSVGPENKKFKSLSEKNKVFEKVGCCYSTKLDVQYPAFDTIDHKESSLYGYSPESHSSSTQKYAGAIEQKHHAPMYLKWISETVGYGIFAEQNIDKDDFIGEYFGVLREVKETSDNLDYAWYYSLDTMDGRRLVVDGKEQGNELRFINHADDPNTVRIDVLGRDGIFHVVYVASRDIKKDEQLTVSYGEGYFTSRGMKVVSV